MANTKNAKKLALWQLGLLLIIAGPLAYTAMTIVMPLEPPLSNAERGQAFGRGLASLLAVVAGIVMIVIHFVRRKR